MNKHVHRDIIKTPFKQLAEATSIDPSRIVITFDKSKQKDIGSLCYLSRAKPSAKDKHLGRRVDPDSLLKSRYPLINNLCNTLCQIGTSLREESLHNYVRHAQTFIDWCDSNDYTKSLSSIEEGQRAFRAYVYHLRDRVRLGEIKNRSATSYQDHVLRLLEEYYETDRIDAGIHLLVANDLGETEPLDEDDQKHALAWCKCLFDGLSDFILNKDTFPYCLNVPKSRNYKTDKLWIFPTTVMYMPPHILEIRDQLTRQYWAYDYANGKLFEIEEIINKYSSYRNQTSYQRHTANTAINKARQGIKDANSDLRNPYRRRLASLASKAFLQLFFAYTGQNKSPVEEMIWPKNYEITSDRQGFRAFKYRANKEIIFEIQSTFLPSFRKYLKLRDWILHETDCDYLFFTHGHNGNKDPAPWSAATENFNKLLHGLDPGIPRIGPRKWRANKSHWINDNAGNLAIAAEMLGHSEATHQRSYMAGTEGRTADELSSFFKQVVISTKNKKTDKGLDSSIGHCINYGNPTKTESSFIQPDCNQPEGCLFCKHFYLHADEEDIRKLASCRYVIFKTQHLSVSQEQFDTMYNSTLERINSLFDHVKNMNKKKAEMVNRIIQEVDQQEELSEYWASELRMLVKLNMAF